MTALFDGRGNVFVVGEMLNRESSRGVSATVQDLETEQVTSDKRKCQVVSIVTPLRPLFGGRMLIPARSPMQRHEAQTFHSAGALQFAKRTSLAGQLTGRAWEAPLLPRGPIERKAHLPRALAFDQFFPAWDAGPLFREAAIQRGNRRMTQTKPCPATACSNPLLP